MIIISCQRDTYERDDAGYLVWLAGVDFVVDCTEQGFWVAYVIAEYKVNGDQLINWYHAVHRWTSSGVS